MDPRAEAHDPMDDLGRRGLLEESAEELYEYAPAGYCSSLLDGTIVRVNGTLLGWLGYRREEVVGRLRIHDLLPPGARIYYETHYAPLLQMQGRVREIAVELLTAQGRRLPVLLNSVVVEDEAGTPRIVRTTVFDASERRRYERELLRARADAEARARAADALQHVAEAVLLVGEAGQVEVMNPAAEALFGVAAAEAVGRQASEALPGWEEMAAGVGVSGADAAATPRVLPFVPGGHERWVSVAAVDAGGATAYTIRDVTEERRLEQLRSDMVAIVSHELRTPLTGAYGAARTLLERYAGLGDDQRRMLVQMVVDQTDRLAKIVDQVLLTSELDNENTAFASERFDCVEVLDAVARTVEPALARRIVVHAREGVVVRADLDRLRQVVSNLVQNALKYSSGEVRLRVEEREFWARLAVEDDGPGIPPRDRHRVFEKFVRLDPLQQTGVGGTGLGLYIARELVQRMGGRIGLQPRERGSTFYVDLPRA